MQGSNWHVVKNQPTWQEHTTGHSVLSIQEGLDTTLWDASKRLHASIVTLTGILLLQHITRREGDNHDRDHRKLQGIRC